MKWSKTNASGRDSYANDTSRNDTCTTISVESHKEELNDEDTNSSLQLDLREDFALCIRFLSMHPIMDLYNQGHVIARTLPAMMMR